ncbi:MAG: hypothetical protein ACRESY_01490, partial [Steroidobacteraceae bacterium]
MSTRAPAHRTPWVATSIGVLALLACLTIGRNAPEQALLSYLFTFLFFTGLSIGSLALLMVHALTGGAWGSWLRQPLLAAARTLPLQAVLLIPILMGMHWLYPWARAPALQQDALLRAQAWYLNTTFFVCRSVLYFILWLALLAAVGARHHPGRDGLPRIAAIGLIVYALSTLLASTDWAMSLMPHW